MKNVLSLLAISFLLFSCNDGDIITESLEFGDTFENCGEVVFYKIKTDPGETLSYQIVNPAITLESFFVTIEDPTNPLLVVLNTETFEFDINSTNKFNYRTYSGVPTGNLFCNDVPPSGINITQDNQATSGDATFSAFLVEDDNDGIPAAFEDINSNGDLDDDDTDGDGLPNYLDDDDDGDNVKTITEQPNYTEENGLSLADDTDDDSIPDYLDTDDDNDGVPTRHEVSGIDDLNPTDDIFDNNVGPDYKNPDFSDNDFEVVTYNAHEIEQTFTLQLIITDLVLPVLNQDVLNFGTQEFIATPNRTVTPTF